jgi:ribose transport system permease protein
VLACSAAIAITLIDDNWPAFAAIGLGLLLSVAVGIANGYLVSVIEIPALFTTLASGLLVLGVTRALVVPHYQVFLQPGHDWLLKLGGTVAGGLPVPVIAFAICALVVHLFLSRTVIGRFIYAHGDNAQAARLSGMATRPLTMLEYAICSGIGYVGGIIMVGSTSLMHLQIAESTLIFDVILVVVLGGVSLVGGRGNVASVIAGTLLIGVLLNAMTIMNLDIQTQDMIKGGVLLLAITLDSYIHPRDEETAKQGD